MEAPEGYEHLDPEFWDRVIPDPSSDCWIFQTDSPRGSYKSVTLLVALLGPANGQRRYRKCERLKCVNPEHVVEGVPHRENPKPRRVGRGPAGQRRFERWYAQC